MQKFADLINYFNKKVADHASKARGFFEEAKSSAGKKADLAKKKASVELDNGKKAKEVVATIVKRRDNPW